MNNYYLYQRRPDPEKPECYILVGAGEEQRNADGLAEEQVEEIKATFNSYCLEGTGTQPDGLRRMFPHTFAKPEPSPTTWEHTGIFMPPPKGQWYESIDSWRSPKLSTGEVKDPRWILKKIIE